MNRSSGSVQEERSSEIARVLIANPVLVRNWTEWCGRLGLHDPGINQWTILYNNGTLNPHQLFKNIIECWKSENGNAASLPSLCETLRNMGNVQAAESLESEFGTSQCRRTSSWPLWFNVGKLNKHFVGRKAELNKLENSMEMITLISGLGGIGKTECVKKFAHDRRKKGSSVTWFDGETEQALHQSLLNLAEIIGLRATTEEVRNQNTTELFRDLIHVVQGNKNSTSWLVIFDNADDLHPDLLFCLQLLNESENTMAILTSRNQSLAKEDWQFIPLEEWEAADAMEFVKSSLQIETDKEDDLINALCERLGNHALAMQQAMAYIIQQRRNSTKGNCYSIQDYFQEFDAGGKKTAKLLDYKLSGTTHKFSKTTYVTWDITATRIKDTYGAVGQLASSILERIAYFDPQGIPLDFIKKLTLCELSLEGYTGETINEAVELLKAYSLVKIESCLISIHRLVQQVIRIKLKYSNEEFAILAAIVQGFKRVSQLSRSELPHFVSVWKYSSCEDDLIRKFARITKRIFYRLKDFGLISDMHNFTICNAARLEQVLGKYHRETLQMKANLALSLDQKGEWEKSLKLYKKVWKKMRKILGEKHESTLAIASNMALVLQSLKRLEEAEEIWKKVWKSEKKTLGENHPLTITTKHNLAILLSDKDEMDLAMKMLNEVLAWELKKLGERDPETLTTKHNIGCCLFEQRKYSEAKEIFDEVLKLQREELGEEHPDTLVSFYWLGLTHSKFPGGKEKSQEILQKVLPLEKKVLGDNHPDTLRTQKRINAMLRKKAYKNNTQELAHIL